MLIRALTTIFVLFSALAVADAQIYGPSRAVKPGKGFQQQILEPFQALGTIEAIAPGKILILTQFNENWMIWLQPQTKLITVGEAKAEFLYAGLFVQFKAELDRHRNVTRSIEELTVITPSQEKTPGIYPLEDAKADSPGRKTSAAGPCMIIGRISALRNDKLQIQVPQGTQLCQLSENAKIRLEVADYSMARKGDKISVMGLKMRGAAGQVQAVQVKIELAETLAGMNVKSLPVKPQTQYRSKSPAKPKLPEGLPLPPDNR